MAQSVSAAVKDCEAVLVKETYNKIEYDNSDWRLADSIEDETYDNVQKDFVADGYIYGVPVGATFKDFKENIKKLRRGRLESFSKQQFRNILWTGLDPNAAGLYQECLKIAALAARKTLTLLPEKATSKEV